MERKFLLQVYHLFSGNSNRYAPQLQSVHMLNSSRDNFAKVFWYTEASSKVSSFRREFNVTGVGNYTELTFDIVRDDGAIVYLNGKEVVPSHSW